MELSAFGREQLGGKRKGTRLGAGSRGGWTREREKNMLKDRMGEKRGGKKNPRDGKHYINSEKLAAPSTRPISNGSTHYDNCILRIYKTKK